MAPSIDCIASLYCAEDVTGGEWDDEEQESGQMEVQRLTTDLLQPIVFLDFPVEDDDAIAVLLQKESRYMPEADYPGRYRSRDLNAGARQNAISWMLKVQACHNFGPLTIALSVNYMDRFMSRHHLLQHKTWMLQLLSVACISLAAKMEETEVPILLDLQVENAEHIFEAHTIQRMELLVLSTLEWQMSSVTPFSYIDYYFHKLGISNTLLRALLSRVSEIILATVRETMFLVYQPSVIAAAATICSLEEVTALQAADLHRVFVDLSVNVDALKKCYQDIQVHLVDSHCRQQSSKKRGFQCLSEPLSPVGVLEAAAFSRNGHQSTTGSSPESSPGVGLLATPTNAHKQRKLDDFCSSLAWL
jgi:cyclin D1/2/4